MSEAALLTGRVRRRRASDLAASSATWLSAAAVCGLLLWIVADVVTRGAGALSVDFILASPADAGRSGGIAPVLVSTGLVLLVCVAAAVPLGLGTAALLSELAPRTGRLARVVRRSLDVLAGVPSIVFGLFGNAFFCGLLGLGYSILAGGLTLACMVLPFFIRAAEEALAAVPDAHRLSGAALGMSRATLVLHVLLPAAAPGLAAGLVLGTGRALAETAALLFTSGYVDRMPGSVFDSGRAISVHIYDLSLNVAGGAPNAYATALVLIALILAIDGAFAWLGWRRAAHRSAG